MEFSADSLGHRHCETCVKVGKCTKRPVSGKSCSIIYCSLNCGQRFHGCKEVEHLQLCSNVKEQCINFAYGCPAILLRKERGPHLKSCPASCVPCTAEWNRWPLCSKERQAHIPFLQMNPHIQEDQLDVALALRDQDILNHWMSLPRKVKKLMRCNATPRHPAIPLVPSLWNSGNKSVRAQSLSSDDGRTVNFESTPRRNHDQSDASILSVTSTDDESPWGRRLKPPGLLHSVWSQLFNNKTERAENASELMAAQQNLAAENKEDDTLSDISNDLDDSKSDLAEFVPPESSSESTNVLEPPSLPCLTTLGLDLSIECIPRYQNKPKSMYTFVCGKDFRRDEYDWHYRNWHSDIHGGLDGWIEQRCPLARYGCSYARRRIYPVQRGYRVIYSKYVNSFGVTCANIEQNAQSSTNGFTITDLPFELLRNIASFLDPFSLGHLSLTCSLLRDVAFSLLRSKGLVLAQWGKNKQGWIITHYRWTFSSAFSPVQQWGFEDGDNMSNHLATCRYNIKSDYPLPSRIALPYPLPNPT